MTEWPNVAVLKTAVRLAYRGFESLSLRDVKSRDIVHTVSRDFFIAVLVASIRATVGMVTGCEARALGNGNSASFAPFGGSR